MTDNTILEQAQKICRNLLDLESITPEKIKDAISKVGQILPLNETDREILFIKLLEITRTTQDAPRILDNSKVEPWVIDKWAEKSDQRKFWKRYRDYLTDEKKIAPKVISRLDELTDNILDRLADPEANDQFDKRGLVVGHVQSGKTSNYLGLITKAADAGYKVIVVLAGIHNSLRSQTQLRIDEGFLGYDTVTSRSFNQSTNRMGVGRFDPNVAAHSLTSSAPNGDFRRNVAETINLSLRGSDPVVIVIKKNNSVLKNLIHWLSAKVGEELGENERIINDIPLLLIDDEADNASINISKSSVSSINGSIRALLELFRKSAYVGYTATPYANVFIPQPKSDDEPNKGIKIMVGNQDYNIGEDLFPRNFIINIPPPSNYVGPEKFFGIMSEDDLYEETNGDSKEPLHLYEPVNDYQPVDYFDSKTVTENLRIENSHFIPDKHKKDDSKPKDLPESLKKAIKCFIISCAARRVRGQINVHNSMLVHVTRFVDWQNHIALLVDEELSLCKRRIEFQHSEFIGSLKDIWEKDFEPKTKKIINSAEVNDVEIIPISWNDLELQLLPAVIKIRIRAIHGSNLLGGLEPENVQALDYYENRKKGLSVIAIGGNKLSRGLTLEGLTISYYLRASKMYDTLMQMGRWFGYRPGYLDLCRLFTSYDLVSHYKHITAATEEMRAEFDRMWLLRKKPIDYGLKVRAHTGILTITAANKFRYKKFMSFSFSGELKETWQFDKLRKDFFEKNHLTTQVFIEKLGEPTGPLNGSSNFKKQPFVWHGKNNFNEVLNYLNDYVSSQPSFHLGLLREYIEKQARVGKLVNWTIAFINNSAAAELNQVNYYGNKTIGLSLRTDAAEFGSQNYELNKAHIIGNFHEYIDLTDDGLEKALRETASDRKEAGKEIDKNMHPNPLRIRTNRPETNGLLLIYPLNPVPKVGLDPYSVVPIIGIALSFPYIEKDEKVTYAVNDVFIKELYDYPEELDSEDLILEDDEESKLSIQMRNTLGKDKFQELLEADSSRCLNLQETEFSSGIVPNYLNSDDIGLETLSKENLIVPKIDKLVSGTENIPYYTEKEIQRFYLNESTEYVVLRPDNESIINGEYIVGLKRSKYVLFSYYDQKSSFSDSCWIIRSGRFNAKYLVSVFNSTLFGAWVRVNGKQKKDTYFITATLLNDFPLLLPDVEDMWLYENLYDLLVTAGKYEDVLGSGTMKSYYSNILDALIFTCYFSQSLERESKILHSELKREIPKNLPTGNDLLELVKKLFAEFYNKKHPVREILFHLDNQSKVSRIKSVFTQ